MLKEFAKAAPPDKEELRAELDRAKDQLAGYQMKIKEAKLPVMVIIEGWGAAGKGSIIGKVIRNIDPRFFKVVPMAEPTEREKRYPFLYRYMLEIPEAGKFVFFDTYWMQEVTEGVLTGKIDEKLYKQRISSINTAERSLHDNGYLIMKFFFHISRKEQKKRIDALAADKDTKWRVSETDVMQNRNYDRTLEVYDRYLEDTNRSVAPWYIIDAGDRKWAELKKLQKELGELHNRLYRLRIPVIIGYEGWDAAGKGGNIKRIAAALDPRGYEVHPIASPEPHEKARHFLWRFWNRLPKDGHIAIFDRTWYGRVMVERLEGFCSENDWQRAYNEINEFENELHSWGAVVIKFWVQIDNETQLKRFQDRQNTPEKQWKITDEDWRNREKWPQYEDAVNEMLQKTNTSFAPWYILESVDKKYARIKALKIVIREIRKACREKEKNL